MRMGWRFHGRTFPHQREDLRISTLGDFVKIFVVENPFEADLVTQALQGEGIPVMVKKFSDTAYDGIYIPQKGWAAIMVPEEWRALGEKVVAEFEEVFRKRRESGKKAEE
jgi:hypothetical protein